MSPDPDTYRDDDLDEALRDLPASERRALAALAERLHQQRPLPRPALRAAIRAELMARSASQPARLKRVALAYISSGALLLAVAAAGVAGLGPLAA